MAQLSLLPFASVLRKHLEGVLNGRCTWIRTGRARSRGD